MSITITTWNVQNLTRSDLVFADTGWQDYVALAGKRLIKVPKVEPMTNLLSVYGVAGLGLSGARI